ncbi:MAG: T9SS type A sorting domain-containing protein [Candidatus Cloacimonetes bacterium]|nr:T9SS type A sorting domain-containing protein [Candidatus Cloacimonadota bacterium]
MRQRMLLLFVLVLSCTGLFADGVQPAGSGTSASPYQVATLDNLLWVSTNSSSWGAYFEQTADIDASATTGWNAGEGFSPIGDTSVHFTGNYNGQDYTIDDLFINGLFDNTQGFFGETHGATLENIGLTNINVSGIDEIGGLVGYNYDSTISNCFSTGSVSGSGIGDAVGGLVGINYCSTIINCYSTSNVNGGYYIGGLVGGNSSISTISDCYSTSNVNGAHYVGGFVGRNWAAFSNCYSTGSVSGTSLVGGLVGTNETVATISNSFWDTETSGTTTGIGGGSISGATGKTTAEMLDVATYTDLTTAGLDTPWDFETNPYDDNANDNHWDMDNSNIINNGYPFLAWQNGDDITLPVELSSFSALVTAGQTVMLEWVTQTECNMIGYHVLRGDSDSTLLACYVTTGVIPATNSAEETSYNFEDSEVEVEHTYYYWLEGIDSDGTTDLFGPVSATILPEDAPDFFEVSRLNANYPNPFNPDTTIDFSLRGTEGMPVNAELAVYNIRGRRVHTLHSGLIEPGNHSITWHGTDDNGRAVGSGIYFIRMQAGDHTEVRKAILMK